MGKEHKTHGFKALLAEILKANAHRRDGGRPGKTASTGTQTKRWSVVFNAFETLRHELGYSLQDPANFRLKHMAALVAHWEKKGLSPSTIQNNISILRLFAGWIGKRGMIPATEALVSSPEKGRRSYAADRDKSWSGAGVDVAELLARVGGEDPRVAMQMELEFAFGLRVEEAWKLRPSRGAAIVPSDSGAVEVLNVLSGTKGGRHRLVFVRTEAQREVLRRAAAMAGGGSMIPPGHTEKEWRNRYYWVLRKLGVSRKSLGVTSHGLRHEFANAQYRERLGVESPVRGGGQPVLSRDDANREKRQLAEELGHSRTSIVTAYSGSKRSVKKPRLDWVSVSGSGSDKGHGSGSESEPEIQRDGTPGL
jgi:integrase